MVLTTSSSAFIVPKPNVRGVVVDQSTFNDDIVATAWIDDTRATHRGIYVYAAAKTEAERATWAWHARTKPGFVLTTVLPNCNWGRILISEHQRGSTMRFFYVNVQECTRIHAAALLNASVHQERVFAFAGDFNWTDVIGILRRLRPDLMFPDPPIDEGHDFPVVTGRQRALGLLKSVFGQSDWQTALKAS